MVSVIPPIQRSQSFEEIFCEPYEYAGDMILSALQVQSVAVSSLQRVDFCATLIDLASRAIKLIVGLILAVPLINIVALQILRFLNISDFAPVNSQERLGTSSAADIFSTNSQGISIPWEILRLGTASAADISFNEDFREMSNQGEVLVPQDLEPLSQVSVAEYQQRKADLIQALTHQEAPLAVENLRCTDEVNRFDLDAILARFRTDHPHRALEQFFEYANVPSSTRYSVHGSFGLYGGEGLSVQKRNAVHNFSRLYDFLSQKKALFQNHPKEDLFKAEIRCIFDKIRNAHNNCIDQVGAQLETIIVETIASYEAMRTSSSQSRTALLRCMAARALFSHKLRLISEICVKEYPNEPHFVVIEREAKRLLAEALGLNGQIFEVGAQYRRMINDMERKALNVAEIFLHGRPLERYQGRPTRFRRANRNYAADQYRPEKFFADGLTPSHGHLRSLRNSIMLWATDYFRLGEEDDPTRQCIELISANDEMTADIGGDLKPEALLHFLRLLGIFESRSQLARLNNSPTRGRFASASGGAFRRSAQFRPSACGE